MNNVDKEISEVALHVLKECMGVMPSENVCIVTDERMLELAYPFHVAARDLGCESVLVEMNVRKRNGEEPPQHVAKLMESSDVILAITTKSLSHTNARKVACGKGARMASLPGISVDCVKRTLIVDYAKIKERSEILSDILTKGKMARLYCPLGTDLHIDISQREGAYDHGDYRMAKSFGNLPAGEAYIAPLEGSSNGKVVFNSSFAGVGICKEPIYIQIEDGNAVSIEGKSEAEKLKSILEPLGEKAYNLAELGIGTNDKAMLTGLVLEDEKVMGTVHLAFGDNSGFGGNTSVPVHLDGIIVKPTLIIDGEMIMESGELVI